MTTPDLPVSASAIDLMAPATKADILTLLAIQSKIVVLLVPDTDPNKAAMLTNIRQARAKIGPHVG